MKPYFVTSLSVFLFACSGSTTNIDGGAADGGNDTSTTNDGSTQDVSSQDVTVADGSGGPCMNNACTNGLSCCGGTCVNETNDPHNCGGCGSGCGAGGSVAMMCYGSMCVASRCQPACKNDAICCEIEEGPTGSQCVNGTTCPVGCPTCQ
jgi:hypothetical protein